MERTDEELAKAVNDFIMEHQPASRAVIRRKLQTSGPRLARLERMGLIHSLPPALHLKAAAIMAARASPWRKFLLRGSPTNGKRTKPRSTT